MACGLIAAAAYAPLLATHALTLWSVPAYRLLPVVWIAGFALMLVRVARLAVPLGRRSWRDWLVALSLGLLVGAIALQFTPLAGASAMVFIAACADRCGGGTLFRLILPAWLWSWPVVLLPLGGDAVALRWAYDRATAMATATLDACGVLFAQVDEAIVTEGPRVLTAAVDHQVVFPVGTALVAALYAFWRGRHAIHGGLLIAWALLWAAVAEVARVVAIVWLASSGFPAADRGWRQALLVSALGVVIAWLAWNMDELIALRSKFGRRKARTEVPIPPETSAGISIQVPRGLVLTPDGTLAMVEATRHRIDARARRPTVAIAAAFGVLLALQICIGAWSLVEATP